MPVTHESKLEFSPTITAPARTYFDYREAAEAIFDPRGRVVRFAPRRRTVMHELPDATRVYCKIRRGRSGDAAREWQTLASLSQIGLNVPPPLFLAMRGRDSVIGLAAVPGRPVDVLLAEGRELDRVLREMPAIVRRLHNAGWVYRDLYWNHVFAPADCKDLWLIDVERAFRPRSRFERWRVKDLAGLVSSLPDGVDVARSAGLRFLREALGELPADYKTMVRKVLAKAARIRGHVTKYPG